MTAKFMLDDTPRGTSRSSCGKKARVREPLRLEVSAGRDQERVPGMPIEGGVTFLGAEGLQGMMVPLS